MAALTQDQLDRIAHSLNNSCELKGSLQHFGELL